MDTCNDLEGDKGGVLLRDEKHIFELRWKGETGGYLCGVRKYGSVATKEQEIEHKKE